MNLIDYICAKLEPCDFSLDGFYYGMLLHYIIFITQYKFDLNHRNNACMHDVHVLSLPC